MKFTTNLEMKANDLLFRIKELAQAIQMQLPVLTDSNTDENIKNIAEMTRQSSEIHQRFIMLETLIHRETGFQKDQNSAVRNFLNELKQVVAVSDQGDAANQQFIQFVAPIKVQENLEQAADTMPTPIEKVLAPSLSIPIPEPILESISKPLAEIIPEQIPDPIQKLNPEPIATTAANPPNKAIQLAINDRFRIMNELFSKQAHKLDENIQLLNTMDKSAALTHWRTLSLQQDWDEELEIVKTFKSVIFNRYV